MAARLCPHCDVRSNFTTKASDGGFWGKQPETFSTAVTINQCQNCAGVLLTFTKNDGTGNHIEWFAYPMAIPKIDSAIPETVASDFISGANCFSIGEHKAAATMFRRSLQQVMIDKKAVGSRLVDQINDLEKKGVITTSLKDWAHEIRLWGNEGAHPPTDGLDELQRDDIEEVENFLERLFDYIYIMLDKVTKSRSNRTMKHSAT